MLFLVLMVGFLAIVIAQVQEFALWRTAGEQRVPAGVAVTPGTDIELSSANDIAQKPPSPKAAHPEWEMLSSEAGNFSVRAPGAMHKVVNVTATSVGPIKEHSFTLERDLYRYSVAYVEYPIPGTTDANPQGALEGQVVRTIESFGASLVTKKDIVLDYAPGIEFRGKFLGGKDLMTEWVVYGRVYLLHARLYQVLVAMRSDQVEPAHPQEFLGSFRWLKP